MMFEELIQNLLIKKTANLKVDKKKLFKSYVSLFLVFAVLVTATVSWFTQKDSATLDTSAIVMNSTSGMRVNSGEDLSGQVVLATDVKLAEASSVDGRNMYFPASESFSNDTANMIFREGNAGDKNTNYYYKDFTLSSDSGDTDVYVKNFTVKVGNYEYSTNLQNDNTQTQEDCPIRIAFITDSSKAPIVIDPTEALDTYAKTYKAVANTTAEGTPSILDSKAHSFANYYFATNNPIFTINESEKLNVTMVAWLEGGVESSSNKSICDKFKGLETSINIEFETNWDNMDIIKFVDQTVGDKDDSVKHWIDKDGCIVTMTYTDLKTGKQKTVAMTKASTFGDSSYGEGDERYTWTVALPKGVVTNIIFNRYSPKSNTVWNAWYTEPGINHKYSDQSPFDPLLDESRIKSDESGKKVRCIKYVAEKGNGYETTEKYRPYPCKGYWKTEGGEVVSDDTTIITKTSDWYLCSNLTGSNAETKLVSELGKDDIYKYKVSLNANSTYTLNFKNIVTANSSTTTTYFGGSNVITDTVTDQLLSKVESSSKFTLKTTTAGDYTITLDVSSEGNYKFTITKVETTVIGGDCDISVTLQDNSSSGWVYKNYLNGDKIYAVFSDGTEVVLKEKGYAYVEYLNAKIESGEKLLRIEMRNSSNKVYYKWDLNLDIKKSTTFKCTVNSNDKITVTE